MPTKPESEMTTEEFLESLKESTAPKDKKKKPETIKDHSEQAQGGIRGYFGKRNKIMEELDK
jgi:phosphoglycerol transferase MdoB-like AlkP superfamily enzyme